MGKYILRPLAQTTRQAEDRDVEPLCMTSNADRCLAKRCLGIGAAFASDDEIGVLDDVREMDGIENKVDTGREARSREK